MYGTSIIYPKYRALIPVTMFCEYLDSGRCNALSHTQQAVGRLSGQMDAQAELQSDQTKLISDKTAALATIEENKLYELRKLTGAFDL